MGLRSSLPALREGLQEKITSAFRRETGGSKDWVRMRAGAASYRVAGAINCFVILGEKLGESFGATVLYTYPRSSLLVANDPSLAQAALQFAQDAAITTELMRFTPTMFQGSVDLAHKPHSPNGLQYQTSLLCVYELERRL